MGSVATELRDDPTEDPTSPWEGPAWGPGPSGAPLVGKEGARTGPAGPLAGVDGAAVGVGCEPACKGELWLQETPSMCFRRTHVAGR